MELDAQSLICELEEITALLEGVVAKKDHAQEMWCRRHLLDAALSSCRRLLAECEEAVAPSLLLPLDTQRQSA